MNKHVDRIAIILGLVAAIVVATVLVATKAAAVTQPYGGCKEAWRYPHSAGADDCRALGWTIKRKIVVNPNGIVRYSSLPHCSYPKRMRWCTWNVIFTRDLRVCDGDCYRAPYWSDRKGRTHFVKGTRQRKELFDPYYVNCDYPYCGIVGPDAEDMTP